MKKALQSSATIRESGSLPPEMFDQIQESLLSDVLCKKWENMDFSQRSQLVDTLSSQVDKLYAAVKRTSEYFWPALLNSDDHLGARPDAYSHGSEEEMQLVLNYSWNVWKESPGALDVIKSKALRRYIHIGGELTSLNPSGRITRRGE